MKITCINCPMGCQLEVNREEEKITVSGNACARGDVYGKQEFISPKRTLTSLVRVYGGAVVPCKTSGQIPKDRLFDVLKKLNKITVTPPKNIGDVIIKDVLNLGVDIVITKNIN